MCFINPSPAKFVTVATAFHIYHTIKNGLRPIVDATISRNRFVHVMSRTAEIAKEYLGEYKHRFSCPRNESASLYTCLSSRGASTGSVLPAETNLSISVKLIADGFLKHFQ